MSAQLRMASKRLGFKEPEIVKRAVLFYLATLERDRDIRDELSEWDSLSDEALLRFEDSL